MTALRVLALVDEDGRPSAELERLVGLEGDERRAALTALLRGHYRPVFELDLTRATRAQFREAFKAFGAREGVLAKCEAFFIQAAQDAGVELSSFILAGRHSARRSSGGSSRSRQTAADRAAAPSTPPASPPPQGPSVTIAELILNKYPDFDPMWDPVTQQKWLDGMNRLMESLGQAGNESGAGDQPPG